MAAVADSRSRASSARWPSCTSRPSARPCRRSAAASASSSATSTGRATSRPSASPTSTGNVVVVSTRDCSLQRRHQKLVEEAPAPYLSDAQNAELVASSKAILREAGYVGAGTCEFLVGQDGTISFLEVNTRLQVEHPVTEEVTGIDLVREQFRIADGEPLGYDDPADHRPRDRVPDQRRGRRRGLPARARHAHPVGAAVRPRRPDGLRLPQRPDRARRVRLARRQARGDRRDPDRGARAVAAGARRVRRRGHAHGDPVPPGRRVRPGLRRRRRQASRSTPAGSRPSSTTRSSAGSAQPSTARRRRRRHRAARLRGRRPADRGRRPGRCARRRRSLRQPSRPAASAVAAAAAPPR